MIVSLIAALEADGGIGRDGRVPWHLGDDLRRFKRLTMGHHVLMGRKTYATVAGKLPGRKMIVLSRDAGFKAPEAQVAAGLEAGLELARAAGEEELFVIGGAQVFVQALPLADRLYLTRLDAQVDCDVFFPEFSMDEWEVLEQRKVTASERNDFPFEFLDLQRRST